MDLTREQIEQMPAGREMDTLVYHEVFGRPRPCAGYSVDHRSILPYSTYIAAAWQVVEHLDKTARLCDITRINGGATYLHHCEVWNTSGAPYDRATADTAPLAICRAALLAHLSHEQ